MSNPPPPLLPLMEQLDEMLWVLQDRTPVGHGRLWRAMIASLRMPDLPSRDNTEEIAIAVRYKFMAWCVVWMLLVWLFLCGFVEVVIDLRYSADGIPEAILSMSVGFFFLIGLSVIVKLRRIVVANRQCELNTLMWRNIREVALAAEAAKVDAMNKTLRTELQKALGTLRGWGNGPQQIEDELNLRRSLELQLRKLRTRDA